MVERNWRIGTFFRGDSAGSIEETVGIDKKRGNKMPVVEETYDIVVVGAGHAGCEAALAAARLGFETIMFTVSVDSIALMPCNPNVGGSSKGHLVRELDALGGEMGKNIDKTFIQSKMLKRNQRDRRSTPACSGG